MCRRRVAPLMVQLPPLGGGDVAVQGGAVPGLVCSSHANR